MDSASTEENIQEVRNAARDIRRQLEAAARKLKRIEQQADFKHAAMGAAYEAGAYINAALARRQRLADAINSLHTERGE